jgi:MFS family permease
MSRAPRDYVLLLAAAFAWGSTSSQLTMLPVILRDHGMSPPQIAVVLSTIFIVMVPGPLLSGALAARIGTKPTMIWAALVLCATLALLPWSLDSVALATLTSAVRGLALGLFTPAGQTFAQSQTTEDDRARKIAWFTAMFLIPMFGGPAIGQWSLRELGEPWFFVLTAAPTLSALIMLCLLRSTEAAASRASGYLTLLGDRRLWLPNLATMQSGLAYGFASTMLPLLLVERGFLVALFFTPFSLALLVIRFGGMNYLQRLSPPKVAGLGLLAYAGGLCFLIVPTAPAMVVAAGLFAIGYGVMLPICVAWSTSYYPRTERARPVALANTSFNIGSIVAVQMAGTLLPVLGWSGVLVVLAIPVTVSMVAMTAEIPHARLQTKR